MSISFGILANSGSSSIARKEPTVGEVIDSRIRVLNDQLSDLCSARYRLPEAVANLPTSKYREILAHL